MPNANYLADAARRLLESVVGLRFGLEKSSNQISSNAGTGTEASEAETLQDQNRIFRKLREFSLGLQENAQALRLLSFLGGTASVLSGEDSEQMAASSVSALEAHADGVDLGPSSTGYESEDVLKRELGGVAVSLQDQAKQFYMSSLRKIKSKPAEQTIQNPDVAEDKSPVAVLSSLLSNLFVLLVAEPLSDPVFASTNDDEVGSGSPGEPNVSVEQYTASDDIADDNVASDDASDRLHALHRFARAEPLLLVVAFTVGLSNVGDYAGAPETLRAVADSTNRKTLLHMVSELLSTVEMQLVDLLEVLSTALFRFDWDHYALPLHGALDQENLLSVRRATELPRDDDGVESRVGLPPTPHRRDPYAATTYTFHEHNDVWTKRASAVLPFSKLEQAMFEVNAAMFNLVAERDFRLDSSSVAHNYRGGAIERVTTANPSAASDSDAEVSTDQLTGIIAKLGTLKRVFFSSLEELVDNALVVQHSGTGATAEQVSGYTERARNSYYAELLAPAIRQFVTVFTTMVEKLLVQSGFGLLNPAAVRVSLTNPSSVEHAMPMHTQRFHELALLVKSVHDDFGVAGSVIDMAFGVTDRDDSVHNDPVGASLRRQVLFQQRKYLEEQLGTIHAVALRLGALAKVLVEACETDIHRSRTVDAGDHANGNSIEQNLILREWRGVDTGFKRLLHDGLATRCRGLAEINQLTLTWLHEAQDRLLLPVAVSDPSRDPSGLSDVVSKTARGGFGGVSRYLSQMLHLGGVTAEPSEVKFRSEDAGAAPGSSGTGDKESLQAVFDAVDAERAAHAALHDVVFPLVNAEIDEIERQKTTTVSAKDWIPTFGLEQTEHVLELPQSFADSTVLKAGRIFEASSGTLDFVHAWLDGSSVLTPPKFVKESVAKVARLEFYAAHESWLEDLLDNYIADDLLKGGEGAAASLEDEKEMEAAHQREKILHELQFYKMLANRASKLLLLRQYNPKEFDQYFLGPTDTPFVFVFGVIPRNEISLCVCFQPCEMMQLVGVRS